MDAGLRIFILINLVFVDFSISDYKIHFLKCDAPEITIFTVFCNYTDTKVVLQFNFVKPVNHIWVSKLNKK